jgi:hypothetical protein
MRLPALFAIVTLGLCSASGPAMAAPWCHTGARGQGCVFETQAQCLSAVRRTGGACQAQAAAPRPTPGRPPWASPFTCYIDEGYGRYRPCDAGGDVN